MTRGWRARLALTLLLVCAFCRAQDSDEVAFSVTDFNVVGDNPLPPAVTAATLAPYQGDYVGVDGLLAAADALQREIGAQGFPFHRVVLPPQTLDAGVVVLEITTFALGEVHVRGEQWSSPELIRSTLPGLRAGSLPNMPALSRQLGVANDHPRRRITLGFRDNDAAADTLDAVINVDEMRRWGLFAGLNNIGNKATGRTRLTVGGQYANLLGIDDVFTTTFITSPDNADDVFQFGAFYQVPIYAWGGWLSGFYVRSDVDVGNVQDIFDVSGSGEFFGISFKRELTPVGAYRHSLTIGWQDRLFETDLSIGATGAPLPSISSSVRSRPISIRYDGGYRWANTTFDFFVDYTRNIELGSKNNEQAYARARTVADPDWQVFRFGGAASRRLPYDFTGILRVTGQYTKEPLIRGEQFGIGGERTVRGFEERTVSGDKGLHTSIEVWTPEIAQLYGLRLLGFVDAGHKRLVSPGVRQAETDTLSSAGFGARWQWQDQLFVTLDYGHAIANADGEAADEGYSKWHFNIQYRY